MYIKTGKKKEKKKSLGEIMNEWWMNSTPANPLVNDNYFLEHINTVFEITVMVIF